MTGDTIAILIGVSIVAIFFFLFIALLVSIIRYFWRKGNK
ncbi:hypothetical protein [Dipodfec virus RodF1_80]|uniref:Uncharacterized protein n=1 Tax=Dipodfec virus RodF1_80 TaxID=2929312 RepID=A0A976N2B3_9VIRU|nr:hypothetical protein [Dipodfec virus RodF1_80]